MSVALFDSLMEAVCTLRCSGYGGEQAVTLGTRGRLWWPCAPMPALICAALHGRAMAAAAIFELWPSMENGTARSVLGTFITTLVMPGIPLLFYGEEQNFYLFDTSASNYLYG